MLLFLAFLATYRVAYLVANERGPFDSAVALRSWVLRRVDLNAHHWLYAGVTCVKCVSWWLALPCVALVQWGGVVGGAVVAWWGVAGGVLVLAQVLQTLERRTQNAEPSNEPTHTVTTIREGMTEEQLAALVERALNQTLNRRIAGWS